METRSQERDQWDSTGLGESTDVSGQESGQTGIRLGLGRQNKTGRSSETA